MVEKENDSFTLDETHISLNSPHSSLTRDQTTNRPLPSGSLAYKIILRAVELVFLLLIGAMIAFISARQMPGDPWTMMLGNGNITSSVQDQINQQKAEWGYDQPIIVQFFMYLGNWLQGNLGVVLTGPRQGLAVSDVIAEQAPYTSQLIVVAILFAAIPAILFGIFAGLKKGSWFDKFALTLAAVFLILPVCGFGELLQYFLAIKTGLFPASLWLSPQNITYPFDITGWTLIDPLLKGDTAVFADAFSHLYLPLSVMAYAFFAIGLVAIRRLVIIIKTKQTHMPHRSYVRTGVVFLVISSSLIITETTFNLHGLGMLLMGAIVSQDYFLILGLLLRFIFIYLITAFLVDLVGILIGHFISPRKSSMEKGQDLKDPFEVPASPDLNSGDQTFSPNQDDRAPIGRIFKQPSVITGLVLLGVFVILAVAGALFYDYASITTMDQNVQGWTAPDSTHILGTAKFGRDVLGRVLWGAVVPLSHLLPAFLVASAIGITLGVLLSVKSNILDDLVNFGAKLLLLVPSVAWFIINLLITGAENFSLILIFSELVFSISFLLAHRIVPPEERYQNNHRTLSQNITRYLPKMLSGAFLACSIAFIAYFTTSFIGFSDPTTVNWANDLFSARAHIYDAPWATIAPMTAIFLFLLSFILLALGFYHSAEESEKEL